MLLVKDDVNNMNIFVNNNIYIFEVQLNDLKHSLENFANNSSDALKGAEWQELFSQINENLTSLSSFISYLSNFNENIKTSNQIFINYIDAVPAGYSEYTGDVEKINDDNLAILDNYIINLTGAISELENQIANAKTTTYNEETEEYETIPDYAAIERYNANIAKYNSDIEKFKEWIRYLEELEPTNNNVKKAVNALGDVNFNYLGE